MVKRISIELLVVQTYGSEEGKVVKGQSGIWLVVYYYVLFSSILGFFLFFVWAITYGKFIRDNLSSRINSVVLSGNDNDEASTWKWEAYKFEILKSWIVVRVCQPEGHFSVLESEQS